MDYDIDYDGNNKRESTNATTITKRSNINVNESLWLKKEDPKDGYKAKWMKVMNEQNV